MNNAFKSICVALMLTLASSAAFSQKFYTMKMDKATLWTYLQRTDFGYFSFRFEPVGSNYRLMCAAMDVNNDIIPGNVLISRLGLSGTLKFGFRSVLILSKQDLLTATFDATTDLYMLPMQFVDASDGNPKPYVSYYLNDVNSHEKFLKVSPFTLNPSPPRNP